MSALQLRDCPYVGLRPFSSADSLYFFGRNEQTFTLLELLRHNRFVAIVGSSGCGKSSLVRAGLVPALLGGFLVADRDRWEVQTIKPGSAPLRNLATVAVGAESASTRAGLDSLTAALSVGQREAWLSQLAARLGERANALVIVDQFEELLAFRSAKSTTCSPGSGLEDRTAESDEFVSHLLALTKTALPIYVVLTMRSDFIGECDQFSGLPEAMNQSRYLVPRLNREQLRQAIRGPALVHHADLSPRLLDRLLDEIDERSDQLPVLQHALLRTWQVWKQAGGHEMPDHEHYQRAGTVVDALSLDAKAALALVDTDLATRVLKALTDTDPGGRQVRRALTVEELARECRASMEQVGEVIDEFQANDRFFVVRERGSRPALDRVEIAHESFIRQWHQLQKWVEAEALDRDALKELVRRSSQQRGKEGDWLSGVDLQVKLHWWQTFGPHEAWALRYVSSSEFAAAREYLRTSRLRWILRNCVLWAALVALVGAALHAVIQGNRRAREDAERAAQAARQAEQLAAAAKQTADAQKAKAEAEARAAEMELTLQRELSSQASNEAVVRTEQAVRQRATEDKVKALEQQLQHVQKNSAVATALGRELEAARQATVRETQHLPQGTAWLVPDRGIPGGIDLDAIPFVEAAHFSKPTSPRSIEIIVLHTLELPNSSEAAERSAAYMASIPDARSFHYAVDSNSVVQIVKVEDIAYHVALANRRAIGIEMAGFSRQSRKEWGASPSKETVTLTERLTAALCARLKIPVRFLPAAALDQGARGITTHAEVSARFGGVHTDPGPNFPMDEFVARVSHFLDASKSRAAEP